MAKQTIQIADKPTLDEVKTLVDNLIGSLSNVSSGCLTRLTYDATNGLSMYLFTGNKIYCADYTVTAVSKCTKVNSNCLKVTSDGVVKFKLSASGGTLVNISIQ